MGQIEDTLGSLDEQFQCKPPPIVAWVAGMAQLENDTREVNRAIDIDRGLSDSEVAFIESIAKQVLDEKRVLTDKQRAWLSMILIRFGK